VGDVDYRVELSPDKVKTYHINMLKRYYHRESPTEPTFNGSRISSNSDDNDIINADQDGYMSGYIRTTLLGITML